VARGTYEQIGGSLCRYRKQGGLLLSSKQVFSQNLEKLLELKEKIEKRARTTDRVDHNAHFFPRTHRSEYFSTFCAMPDVFFKKGASTRPPPSRITVEIASQARPPTSNEGKF